MSTNERDELGEDLVPDYISSVQPGSFYGWPWFYIGNQSILITRANMPIWPRR
jgi:glucose/arabinose dehydrogenase